MHSQETQVEALTLSSWTHHLSCPASVSPSVKWGQSGSPSPPPTSNQHELRIQMQACKALTVKMLLSSGEGLELGVPRSKTSASRPYAPLVEPGQRVSSRLLR